MDNEPKHNTRKIVAEKLGWSTGKKAQFDVVVKKAPEEVKVKLSNYQRSVLALELESVFSARAKENLKLSKGKGKLISAEVKVEPIETRKKLAKIASVGHDTRKIVSLCILFKVWFQ